MAALQPRVIAGLELKDQSPGVDLNTVCVFFPPVPFVSIGITIGIYTREVVGFTFLLQVLFFPAVLHRDEVRALESRIRGRNSWILIWRDVYTEYR